MTKHNENLVMIMAGYPNEISALVVRSNPGLASRFKKYFHFTDYTNEELVQMIELNAIHYGYTLADGVNVFLHTRLAKDASR
ncbi:hypothetical protein KHA80_20800 [Anaerobacillus sp. HL2]|nr:hypothetical protein KHA80_20800 [Anaerobacillus sp. HL2]